MWFNIAMTTDKWHEMEQTRYDGVCDVCKKAFDEGFTYVTNLTFNENGFSSNVVDLCRKCLDQWKIGKTIITEKEAFQAAIQRQQSTPSV